MTVSVVRIDEKTGVNFGVTIDDGIGCLRL